MNIRLSYGDEIPNGEFLFRYCHPRAFPIDQVEIPVGIFQDEELSCDWEKIRTDPLTSYHIGEGLSIVIKIAVCDEIKNIKNPKRTGQIVADWHQDIIYAPVSEQEDPKHGANDAHCLIKGRKKAAVCKALSENSVRL